jgi:hypothetical protein
MFKLCRISKLMRWAGVLAGLNVALAAASGAWAQTAPYIAGVQPDQRPSGAPKIATYDKPADWLAKATRGVQTPHPPSLKFLSDQGAWYTPFTRPGMTGRYDIRQFHRPAAR